MAGEFDVVVCPVCRGDLAWSALEGRCQGCGAAYRVVDGIPVLTSEDAGVHTQSQAAWFDDEANPEWEIRRPLGAPAFHEFLLREKFRRGTSGVRPILPGATALVVCGGSGMDAGFLSEAGARVISSDISLGAAKRAVERRSLHGLFFDVVVADVERLPFPDQSMDVVYVHDGLHHLERPLQGLREMARVARVAVCVTEPAQALLTKAAVRLGIAEEEEAAGNRVGRLTLAEIKAVLSDYGYSIRVASRYGMYYTHEPGRPARFLSSRGALPVSKAVLRGANLVGGRFGNKLAVVATRP
jgi:ubiquinone/menaquinone biosynthesis C-methylase UbiE/uncharacterized protein YbaR (Trm112 family)